MIGAPLWDLLTKEPITKLGRTSWVVIDLLCVPSYLVAVLIWGTRWRLARESAAITGQPAQPFVAERLLHAGRRVVARVMSWLGRMPRTFVTLGWAALLISPFTMIATTCNGSSRSGIDLLLDRNDAVWFTGAEGFGESFLPHLGRGFYGATILIGLVAATMVLLSAVLPTTFPWSRAARRLRPFGAIAAFFLLVDVGYVFPIMPSFFINDLVRIIAFVIPLLLWMRNGRSRDERRRTRWREVLKPCVEVCMLPAVVVVPFTLVRCYAFGLTGLPLYFGGVMLVALPLLALQDVEAEVSAPAVVAPAYPSG